MRQWWLSERIETAHRRTPTVVRTINPDIQPIEEPCRPTSGHLHGPWIRVVEYAEVERLKLLIKYANDRAKAYGQHGLDMFANTEFRAAADALETK